MPFSFFLFYQYIYLENPLKPVVAPVGKFVGTELTLSFEKSSLKISEDIEPPKPPAIYPLTGAKL